MTMGQMPLSGEAFGRLAADLTYSGSFGKYYHSKNGSLSEARSSTVSYQEAAAVKLWSDCEQLVSLTESERPMMLERSPWGRLGCQSADSLGPYLYDYHIPNALIQKVQTKSGICAETSQERWMNPAVHPQRLTTIRRRPHPKDHQEPRLSRAASC